MYLGCHQITNTDAIVVIDRTMISSSNHAKCFVWAKGFSIQMYISLLFILNNYFVDVVHLWIQFYSTSYYKLISDLIELYFTDNKIGFLREE